MILVNLFGQPGAGKSTGAAYIFARLKMAGVNCELATEFAKDKVWEETREVFRNQAYIFGKQWFKITRAENKVDVIITDSPIINSIFYNKDPRLGADFDNLLMGIFNSYDSLNYLIRRVKPYNPKGRFQTEEESDKLRDNIEQFLMDNKVLYLAMNGTQEDYDLIVEDILSKISGEY